MQQHSRAQVTAAAAGRRPPRFVSAASLFDGHDAAINMIRRLLQSHGAEVVHLGHNRSVSDIVRAALQEDADAIAVSSYQGGHNEYFRYMLQMLRQEGAAHIQVIVGGGGTIAPDEISALERDGVQKIYTPEDGRRLGLDGMIEDVLARVAGAKRPDYVIVKPQAAKTRELGEAITILEASEPPGAAQQLRTWIAAAPRQCPVVGITGTGGAGKSSLTDELLLRLVRTLPEKRIAVVAMDPTRRRSGGALLGDRIRMNSLSHPHIFMRSLATRRQHQATSPVLADVIGLFNLAGFDLVLVETAGIGQSDSQIADLVDLPLYVMTSEYGAPSQLEKIDMLDYAELVVINKFEKRGAEDALRDVRKQWRRNHPADTAADAALPVFPTTASRFNDPGVSRLFEAIRLRLADPARSAGHWQPAQWQIPAVAPAAAPGSAPSAAGLIPSARSRYLAEIAAAGREARATGEAAAAVAHRAGSLYQALELLEGEALPGPLQPFPEAALQDPHVDVSRRQLRAAYNAALTQLGTDGCRQLLDWPARRQAVVQEQYSYEVRGRAVTGDNYTETLSHNRIPKIAVPQFRDWGETLRFLLQENLPGAFPFTAGVYPYRRDAEDPTRMFAGEGGPERTNRRFHYLAGGQQATRLSTAFDSTTLYGEDPDTRPDIYGRTGNSGVSIASLDDMKKLYSGFDLSSPSTSVSMTINGPAPIFWRCS